MLKTRTIFLLSIIFLFSVESTAQREKKKPAPIMSDDLRFAQAEAYFVEGEKYFILEDYAKALAFFQRAAQLNPGDAGVHYKVAEVLSKSSGDQELTMALTSIETALKLDKKNKYYYQLQADIHAAKQEFLKAAIALE